MPARTLEAVTTCQKSIPGMKNSRSLRATVPAVVVSFLELQEGDRLRWIVDLQSGGVTVKAEPRRRE